MDIQDTPIWEEIKEIENSGSKSVFFTYRVEINLPDGTLEPLQITLIDSARDYSNSYSDETVITVKMEVYDFLRRLAPNREDFTVTLIREPLGEIGLEEDVEAQTTTRRYRGVLVDSTDTDIESSRSVDTNASDLSLEPPREYRIQLLHPAVDQLRMMTTGGVYRQMRTDDLAQGLLSSACASLDLDEDSQITGVDLVTGDNDQTREHILIPQGTPLMELAQYIQRYAGGIYNTAIGVYIQGSVFYIYPRFNTRRFEEVNDNLTIFNIPQNRMPATERSHYVDTDGQLIVLATDEVVSTDSSERLQLNIGDGFRYARAEEFFKDRPENAENRSEIRDYHHLQDNVATLKRSKNVEEYSIYERESGLSMSMFSPRRITANHYAENSRLSEALGKYIRIRWENANPDLVYPAMPVRFVWLEDGSLEERYGTLLGADYVSAPLQTGRESNRFASVVDLTVFLEYSRD